MAFKLGNEKRDFKSSLNVTINRGDAGDGALAQANMDGTIDVDPRVNLNSKFGKKVIAHELCHMEQIASGRAAYGDNYVLWEGNIFLRKTENGVNVIDGPNGRWPEGHPNHPWEAEAIQAEKLINK